MVHKSETRLLALALLASTVHLGGCAAVAGAGVAGATLVAIDRRSTGTQVDDQAIELEAYNRLEAETELWEQSHVSVTSLNHIVLVTGETPTEAYRSRVAAVVAGVPKVRTVHNELLVAAPSTLIARSSDSWVTTKVKTTLLGEMAIDATRVKVVTESGVVYLMGLVTREEAEKATELTRRVKGVQRVVRLFEFIDP